MLERRRREIELVQGRYAGVELAPDTTWLTIARFPLPDGWTKKESRLLVLLPPGYPVTPPDNFFTEEDLLLAGGAQPGNSAPGQQTVLGGAWRMFSYHVEPGTWLPNPDPDRGHNLLTYLLGVEQRLRELT
jgi:hypothetical protein